MRSPATTRTLAVKTDPGAMAKVPPAYRNRIPTLSEIGDAATSARRRDQPLLTILSGAELGAVFVVQAMLVLGRAADADIQFSDSTVSWRHARVTTRHGRVSITDLGSTNGTFVEGERVEGVRMLSDGDRISLGPHAELRLDFNDALEARASLSLYESAVRDALTGVHNRRYLQERLRTEFSYAFRNGTALSALMVDIDRFKRVNDRCGHVVGDSLLRVVATAIRRVIRPEDVLARYGGEEFVVLARGIGAQRAMLMAERVRRTIERLPLPAELSLPPISVSIGVAAFERGCLRESPEELLAAADRAMYLAKQRGRNRVVHD